MPSLPKQVQAFEQELDEYEKQLGGESDATDSSAPEPTAPVDPPASATESVAESTTAAPPEGAKWDSDEEKWEHKYRRLQGKYDAEVPRLHQDLKTAQGEIEQLRQHIVAMQQQQQQSAPEQDEKKPEPPLVSQEDVDNFGDDLIDLQRRVAREVARGFEGELSQLRQQNQELRQTLEQTGSQVGAMSFEQRIQQAIPDFPQINRDPKWIAWLDEYDPMVQGPRRQVAQDAYARGDLEAVKGYVDLWRKTAGQAPASDTSDTRKRELQRQVQPTRTNAPAPTDQSGQKTYSESEANKLFGHIQKLVTQGRLEEASNLENEISAAYVEGRVRA